MTRVAQSGDSERYGVAKDDVLCGEKQTGRARELSIMKVGIRALSTLLACETTLSVEKQRNRMKYWRNMRR